MPSRAGPVEAGATSFTDAPHAVWEQWQDGSMSAGQVLSIRDQGLEI